MMNQATIETEMNQTAAAHAQLEQLARDKAAYLEARDELKTIVEQFQRNTSALSAAKEEAESLNQQWKAEAHSAGLKASKTVNKLLDQSIEARSSAERWALLVEEGPKLLAEAKEKTAEARRRYQSSLNAAVEPVLQAQAEAALFKADTLTEIRELFSELGPYLKFMEQNELPQLKQLQGYDWSTPSGLIAQDDMEVIKAQARSRMLTWYLLPMLERLGLNLDSSLPDELNEVPALPIETQ